MSSFIVRFFYLLLAVCIGAGAFFFYFDTDIINPKNVDWLLAHGGDSSQHYLGSYAFRSDTWHFPITKTTWINYPEGVSIIYTDSNPLLSILAKLFRPIFPPEYQFFGFWFLLCWSLQGVFSYLLIRKLTGDTIFALASSALFCLLPAQIDRIGHANLVAFWLIIWSLYVFINDGLNDRKKLLYFFFILLLASLIHAYLCLMCLIVAATWGCKCFVNLYMKRNKEGGRQALYFFGSLCVACFFVFILCIWGLGYFYNRPQNSGLMGFGHYSMNLLGPINPMHDHASMFLPVLPSQDGQYEGYNYLGAGILVLIISALAGGIWKRKIIILDGKSLFVGLFILGAVFFYKSGELGLATKLAAAIITLAYVSCFRLVRDERPRSLYWLFIPATICFLIALSNKVYIGDKLLYLYDLKEEARFAGVFQVMRSSGRYFWVTSMALLAVLLFSIHKNIPRKNYAYLLLIFVIAIQITDLSWRYKGVQVSSMVYDNPLNEEEKRMVREAKFVSFLGHVDMKIAEYALMNKIPVNNFYTAHMEGALTKAKLEREKADFKLISSDTLYLLSLSNLPLNQIYPLKEPFYGGYSAWFDDKYQREDIPRLYISRIQIDSLSSLLEYIKNRSLVVIAVSDEATAAINPFFTSCLDSEFGASSRKLGYRDSYLAVFVEGKLHVERYSSQTSVEAEITVLNKKIFARSAGNEKNIPSGVLWRVDDYEFEQKARGLNILSIDSTSVIDGIPVIEILNFDTHAHLYPF